MLITTLDQERKNIYQAGREEGRVETQRQTILQLLEYRFGIDEAIQAQLGRQLAQIQDSQVLAELLNGLLQKESYLEGIIAQLTKLLPSDQVT